METDCLTRADIRWTSPPLPRVEDFPIEDLLALPPLELLAHANDLREHLKTVRLLLSEALTLTARQQDQLTRAARLIDAQRQQIQDLRTQVRELMDVS